jgi:TonB family protein
MVLPLRVWPHGSDGENQSAQWAHTVEISHIGCRLGGLRSELSPGQTITLQRGQHKAAFRVIWSKQLAANENQAGIEALDYGKDIWAVDLPPSPMVFKAAEPRAVEAGPIVAAPADRPSVRVAGRPRLRWGFGFLLLAVAFGISRYCLTLLDGSGLDGSGRVAIHAPVPGVPTAQDLARLAPKPRFMMPWFTKAWDASTPRLQVAEVPTGHIVYPVAPGSGMAGTVRLQIAIAANGLVKQIHALSGQQALAEAAAQAVRLWRYSAFPGSTPVERETSVTVSFRGPDAVFLQFPTSNEQAGSQANKQE